MAVRVIGGSLYFVFVVSLYFAFMVGLYFVFMARLCFVFVTGAKQIAAIPGVI